MLEQERSILNNMIRNNYPHETILEQSKKVDELINSYMKAR